MKRRKLPTQDEARAIAAKFGIDFDDHLRYAASQPTKLLAEIHNAYRAGAQDEMCDLWRFICWSAMSTRKGDTARHLADAMAAGFGAYLPRRSPRIRACREASQHLIGGLL